MNPSNRPEFSRPVAVESLTGGLAEYDIEATEAERQALALRLDLTSVDSLTASVRLWPEGGEMVRLQGTLAARVAQSCVVTLEPVTSSIQAFVERRFGPGEGVQDPQDEEVAWDGEDPPDAILNGYIDIGEAVAEQLSLEISPFPRAPGAEFRGYSVGTADQGEAGPDGPFSALAKLVKKES